MESRAATVMQAAAPTPIRAKRSRFAAHMRARGLQYAMLAPFVLLFAVFTIVPVFWSIVLSFTSYNMLQTPEWSGISNYRKLFLEDDIFLTAIRNTFAFALVTGPLSYFISFLFAWIINNLKFSNVFALGFYAPSITSSVALAVVWMYIFSGDRYGLLNSLLLELGLEHQPVLWLQHPDTMLKVVMFVSLWMSMGSGFLVFLAGLRNVPGELYEAGAIDGIRGKFQELWLLTLPLMKPQLLFGAVNAIVASFAVFDIAKVLVGMPSPNYAAHTIVAHLYDYAFIRFELGYASAVAVFLFLVTLVLGRVCMRLFSSKDM
ncbi:sugar ABC transporter permease [Paenibacillus hemerocallicola]|uniref:Sugar ABC transporter permease n=1 Tax=Paenibacillus hemerocallicola TaxID=1172614 RepID=A0A5C4SZ28_9BACL|nr:sugar ABC transporter permease [Paenibacillus hemerocallicola]TNJ61946.1 sugar ABC transporter permease [Paenibacillus hemerocallicola]